MNPLPRPIRAVTATVVHDTVTGDGEVVATGLSATVAGAFDDCIKAHDTSTRDRDRDEYKTSCQGVGVVPVEEPDATEELVEYAIPRSRPGPLLLD